MSIACFVCRVQITEGQPAFELSLGAIARDLGVFVVEVDPPPKYAHATCLHLQEIVRPMKEVMKRYVNRAVTVRMLDGSPLTGTVLVAGADAFTILENTFGQEVSRPYSAVAEVLAKPVDAAAPPPPDAIDEEPLPMNLPADSEELPDPARENDPDGDLVY